MFGAVLLWTLCFSPSTLCAVIVTSSRPHSVCYRGRSEFVPAECSIVINEAAEWRVVLFDFVSDCGIADKTGA